MPQSRTLSMGMDVHTDALAVASVAQALHAEVSSPVPLARAKAIVTSFSETCRPQANLSCWSMKRVRAGMGSPAPSPRQATPAGLSPPLSPKGWRSGHNNSVVTPSAGPPDALRRSDTRLCPPGGRRSHP